MALRLGRNMGSPSALVFLVPKSVFFVLEMFSLLETCEK